MEPILAVSDLWVTFPAYRQESVRALKGINLRIDPGEFIGLVGESGAGKTTLARAVMGLVPPPGVIERGQVLFLGRDLSALDDDARRAVLGRELAMVIANPRAELNPVLGFVVFSAVLSLVIYLVVDLIYYALDPRTRG